MCTNHSLLFRCCFVVFAIAVTGTVFARSVDLKTDQYKRIHRRAFTALMDGHADEAIKAVEEYRAENPEDTENLFFLAVAYAGKGEFDKAVDCVKEALELGLPAERFLAGPRELTEPLTGHEPFREYIERRYCEPLHGPMVGCVTDHGARFWVRTATETTVRVRVGTSRGLDDKVRTGSAQTTAERDFTGVVSVDGLQPDTRYFYRVEVEGAGRVRDKVHSFRTYPKTGKPAKFTVGFGGGAGFVPPHEYMWNTIRERKPLAFLLLGDNVYIDRPTCPNVQNYCYYRRQSRPEYREFVGGTCIYAIYDDHDFGTNDCWGGPAIDKPEWKRPVWRLFTNNWVNPQFGGGSKQPGCWFDCFIGDVHFVFLDCRYYRTGPRLPARSMLGPVQKKWLFENLRDTEAACTVLCSSVPWASGTKPDSLDTWDGYPEEREEIFSFLEKHGINRVVLASADRHRSDLWRIERETGPDLYEFESSRLTNQHVHDKIPGAVFSYNELQSFGLLEFDTTRDAPAVTYRIINIDGEEVFTTTIRPGSDQSRG